MAEKKARGMTEIVLRVQHGFKPGFTLDATIESGPRVALMGPSGGGKSSLLLAAAGLLRPAAGRIQLAGSVVFDSDRGINLAPRDRRVGYVPQRSWLFPLRTVRENLCFGRPATPTLPLEEVVEALGIEPLLGRRPARLSGGERQRVALGRAILAEPCALLCDEPFSALDRRRRDSMLTVVERWRARMQIPLLLVSHQPCEVEALADHVAVLEAGRVVAQGSPQRLVKGLDRSTGC